MVAENAEFRTPQFGYPSGEGRLGFGERRDEQPLEGERVEAGMQGRLTEPAKAAVIGGGEAEVGHRMAFFQWGRVPCAVAPRHTFFLADGAEKTSY
jgi:hypothetical protein